MTTIRKCVEGLKLDEEDKKPPGKGKNGPQSEQEIAELFLKAIVRLDHGMDLRLKLFNSSLAGLLQFFNQILQQFLLLLLRSQGVADFLELGFS